VGRSTAEVAIDLGTSNTRIVVRGRGIVVDEPSVVATQRGVRGREVVAVGGEAKRMLGRTPAGTSVLRPIRNGVVDDFEASEQLLSHLLKRVTTRTLRRPRLLVCMHSDTSEVERRAVQESARAAGGREVVLVASGLVAALGADLPVTDAVGSMIVDVGGGRTEAAVVSLGGIVVRRSIPVAGDQMDAAIQNWATSVHNLQIGERTAEKLKLRVGCAMEPARGATMRIRGRDLGSGNPRELDVTSSDLAEALSGPVQAIQEVVRAVLSEVPPELAADIVERGILLCGGGGKLLGLDHALRGSTGLPVLHTEEPMSCVARGAAVLLDDPPLLARVIQAT
jgi:rod shape-determining protein MreB